VIKKTSENGTLLILFGQENSKAPVYDLRPYADPLIRPEKIRTIIHNPDAKKLCPAGQSFFMVFKICVKIKR